MFFRAAVIALLLLTLAGGASAADVNANYRALIDAIVVAPADNKLSLQEQAADLRSAADGTARSRALIAVHRDAAAAHAAKLEWMNATAHLGNGVALARTLEDPDLIVAIHLQQAGYFKQAGATSGALRALDAADAIIQPLGRRPAMIESSLLRAELLHSEPRERPRIEAIYEALLADPQADRFRVELHRARHTPFDTQAVFHERWTHVLELARTARDSVVESEALDQLGTYFVAGEPARAAGHFAAAEQTGAPVQRSAALWMDVIKAYNAVDDRDRARQALAAAGALIDGQKDPGRAADLREATGELLGREGDFAAAFRELRQASELRRRRDAERQSMPFASLLPPVPRRQIDTAAELAAVQSALREAELERTKLLQRQTAADKAFREAELDRARLLQRQTAGIATVAVLLAALLGLAYAYKRRSAAALVTARANAELRADRTHWQMLRYQLNPHFLFNALSSLGGLVATDPRAAGRVVERLSEFCQLALKGSNDDLRTLAQEREIIRAYLDVEQAGAGDTLTVCFDAAPATLSCLVPPLLLQPLVENALKYGGQTSDDHLEIAITARRSADGANLELEVANTGRWIERKNESPSRDAVGLANVRERLARFGGDSAVLTFTQDGPWVRAQLRLPAREGSPGSPAP